VSWAMLLLIGERPPPPPERRPRRVRLPWSPTVWGTTAVAGVVVASTTGGAAGLAGAFYALYAAVRAFDSALPYKEGLREHRQ
jgi:hypothetical protein